MGTSIASTWLWLSVRGVELVTADQKSVNNLAPYFPFIVPLATLP